MSDEIRVSRPQTAPAMSQPVYQEVAASGKPSKMPWVILAVVVVVLLVVGVLFRDKLFGAKSSQVKGLSMTNSADYQAIFLTNGQVYFGKITGMDNDYVTASDIYYLQVVQPPLQGTPAQGQAPAGQEQAQQPQISLVKLGNELHGPKDVMHISRAQILFYEDLKEEGSVVKAIKDYKANPTGAPAK